MPEEVCSEARKNLVSCLESGKNDCADFMTKLDECRGQVINSDVNTDMSEIDAGA